MNCSLDLALFSCSLSLASSSSPTSKSCCLFSPQSVLSIWLYVLVSLSVFQFFSSSFFLAISILYLSIHLSDCSSMYVSTCPSRYSIQLLSIYRYLPSRLITSIHISIYPYPPVYLSTSLLPTRVTPILGADHLSCQSHSAVSRLVCTHDCPRGERPSQLNGDIALD